MFYLLDLADDDNCLKNMPGAAVLVDSAETLWDRLEATMSLLRRWVIPIPFTPRGDSGFSNSLVCSVKVAIAQHLSQKEIESR